MPSSGVGFGPRGPLAQARSHSSVRGNGGGCSESDTRRCSPDSDGVAYELVHVPDQHPAEGIIATAEKNGCDLIMMASHGRRALGRLLLGSQVNEVLAH